MKNNHSAPKGKEKSEKKNVGARGGSHSMAPQQGVAPSKPGQVSVSSASPNNKWGIGNGAGKGHMAGKGSADPAPAGTSSPSSGNNQKWGVSGGKGKMFGKQTASVAQSGTSSVSNG